MNKKAQSVADMNKHLKVRDIFYKFSCHPALQGYLSNFMNLLNIDIVQVCKHGQTEPMNGLIQLWYTPDNYQKYKKEFDKEFLEYTAEELKSWKRLTRIDIPYKKLYGQDWKPDHIEYWGEICFVVFVGDDFKLWHEPKNWESFVGISASGRTFEEMMTSLGQKFFEIFGDFNDDDFLTKAEKKNHKEEEMFFHKPAKDGRGTFLIKNPKFKMVQPTEINRRWVKWFAKTDYAKKNWKDSFDKIIPNKHI
jgi:hypothetical protein